MVQKVVAQSQVATKRWVRRIDRDEAVDGGTVFVPPCVHRSPSQRTELVGGCQPRLPGGQQLRLGSEGSLQASSKLPMRPFSSGQTNPPEELPPASCLDPSVLVVDHQKPRSPPALRSTSGLGNTTSLPRQGRLEGGVLLAGVEPERYER